jgi:hypothetical protein
LGHKHLMIRKIAARALATLAAGDGPSSGSALVCRCLDSLESTNHNQVHGSLLAILELISTSDKIKLETIESVSERLERLVQFSQKPFDVPLLCSATAFEILSHLYANREPNEDPFWVSYEAALSWLEELSGEVAGASKLGATVASAVTGRNCRQLWGQSATDEDRETSIQMLSSLFRSSFVDVRITAVKVFKKTVYIGVDELICRTSTDPTSSKRTIESLIDMLVSALTHEMRRGESDDDSPHPPTLRRLSRCLLDSLCAWESLVAVLSPERSAEMWRIASTILGDAREVGEGFETPLVGNAAELISFVLRQEGSRQTDKVLVFGDLVSRLSQPTQTFRLRHSAAAALKTSQVLQWMESSQMVMVASRLLQDSDGDVVS